MVAHLAHTSGSHTAMRPSLQMLHSLSRARLPLAAAAQQPLMRRGLLRPAASGAQAQPAAAAAWGARAPLRTAGLRAHAASTTTAAAAAMSEAAPAAVQHAQQQAAAAPTNPSAPTFQEAVRRLQEYWAAKGCMVWLPHNTEVGAGTMNPATFLR